MRWLAVVGLSLLTACGTFGRTRPVSVSPPTAPTSVAVGKLGFDARNVDMQGVGTFEFGEFSARDLASLQKSLERSLGGGPTGDLTVHVYVRSHLIQASNNAGVALSCVAWALTEPDGTVVFEEQVYVGSEGHLIMTLGHLKERVHLGLVTRITDVTGALASGGTVETLPEPPPGVSHNPADAARGMPQMLQSHYIFTLGGHLYTGHSAAAVVDPSSGTPRDAFDWTGFLEGA